MYVLARTEYQQSWTFPITSVVLHWTMKSKENLISVSSFKVAHVLPDRYWTVLNQAPTTRQGGRRSRCINDIFSEVHSPKSLSRAVPSASFRLLCLTPSKSIAYFNVSFSSASSPPSAGVRQHCFWVGLMMSSAVKWIYAVPVHQMLPPQTAIDAITVEYSTAVAEHYQTDVKNL